MKAILATDGSESAEQAIRWFCRLPISHSKSYEIIAVENFPFYAMEDATINDELCRLEHVRALESVQRAAAILGEFKLDAAEVVRAGHPSNEIAKYAKESNADLVVVGAHGMSFFPRMLIGSTSESVARHAPCSVLVVRSSSPSLPSEERPLSIAIAADRSDTDDRIIAQVIALGLPKTTKVHLVSVIEHPHLLDSNVEYDTQLTQQTKLAVARLASQLESSLSEIEEHVFEKVHVGQSLLDFIEEHRPDFVVLGDKGRSAIARFLLGSVSRTILQHATCSVLLVRS